MLNAEGFLAAGWFIEGRFLGLVRAAAADSSRWTAKGRVLRLTLENEDRMRVEFASELGGEPVFQDTWHRVVVLRAADASSPYALGYPRFGDKVTVDRQAQATYRVPPRYPEAAREQGVSGTVLIHALVDPEGRVRDLRVTRSVPGLDEAATAAVRDWRFSAAQMNGKAVASWIEVPVKFSLN